MKVVTNNIIVHFDETMFAPTLSTINLVEEVKSRYNSDSKIKVLDCCTGSGIIPILLNKWMPQSIFVAFDIHRLQVTVLNCFANRTDIRVQKIDVTDSWGFEQGEFDVITANPPYTELPPDWATGYNDSCYSVPDGEDWLFYYRAIQRNLGCLKKEGTLFLECAEGQGGVLKEYFKQFNIVVIENIGEELLPCEK